MLQLAAIHFVIVFWNRGDTNENRHQPPAVLAAVNRHGLITFVIANLLTGAVNLSVNTLAVSDGVAVGILVVYLCTVGLVAVVVDRVWKYLVAHQKSALGERPSQSTTEQKSQATTEQKKRD